MPRFHWPLARVPPSVIIALFLMMMYKNYKRLFRPMISKSPIFVHLLAILRDTHVFHFFAKSELRMMLLCSGHLLHLFRTICGKPTYLSGKIMQTILLRILSSTLGNPAVASFFSTIMDYPLERQDPQIQVSITTPYYFSHEYTISSILYLVSILPKEQDAILNFSIENLTPSELDVYHKIYLLVNIRKLFLERNEVLIFVCRIFDDYKQNPWERSDFSDWKFGQQFEDLRKKPDFGKFMDCMCSLSIAFLQPQAREQSDFLLCIQIMRLFHDQMTDTCNWTCMSNLLSASSEDAISRLLNQDFAKRDDEITFSLSFPPQNLQHRSEIMILPMLRKAYNLGTSSIPEIFLLSLHNHANAKISVWSFERNDLSDVKSQYYRILLLVFNFVKFVTSDTPDRDFIISCFAFLESNHTHEDLDTYLDLHKWMDPTHCKFYQLLSNFCEFADPNMHCAEKTKRSFLSLFRLLRDVLTNVEFFQKISTLMEKDLANCLENYCVDHFICDLANQGSSEFLCHIQPFRRTKCVNCNVRLPNDLFDECEECREECREEWSENDRCSSDSDF